MAKKIPSEMSNLKSKISNLQSLRVLMVEDSEDDMLLEIRELKKGGYDPVYERVETEKAMSKALREKSWDIILCDYKLPHFSGTKAIALLKEINIDIPVIIVSGAIGEETAVECMRLGAHDYVMKGNLPRLVPAIERELKEAASRSKRKQAEEALSESEALYKKLFDNHAAVKLMIDPDTGNIIDANEAAANFYGWSCENLKQMKIQEINTLSPEEVKKEMEKARTQKQIHFEFRHRRADGSIRNVDVFSSKIEAKGKDILHSIIHDITERKWAVDALRQSEEKYRNLVERANDGICFVQEGILRYTNARLAQIVGYSVEELTGKPFTDFFTPEEVPKVLDRYKRRMAGKDVAPIYETALKHNDGSKVDIEINAGVITYEGKPADLALVRDITERKRAEEELRQSEEKYRTILENIEDGYYEVDLTGNFTFFNDSACRIFGYPQEEMMGMNNRQYTDDENLKKVFSAFNGVYKTGVPTKEFAWQIIRKDGTKRLLESSISLQKDSSGKPIGFRGISRDITERKQAEEELKVSEAQYRWLSEHITDGVWLLDMNLKPTYQSPSMEKLTGFTHEELMELPMEKRVTPESFKLAFELFLELLPRIMADSDYNPLRTLELECCCKDGTILWTENKFSGIRDENGKPVSILAEVRDITERKQAEEERQQSFERMRKALRATVQSISMIVEMKDPYTSGHQQRVADLARSIATEMGLSADRRDFIRTASAIHDIGKIAVPAEILSKPTKLTDLEFNLIKTHSQSGYDILKDIEFPWPVADVVLQHHERMNGSGYPHGLKGDDILLEARILAVADVVEAIASHRPYRPALGIDLALEEISGNKGILYDADAVDACLKLFREKGYTLVLKK